MTQKIENVPAAAPAVAAAPVLNLQRCYLKATSLEMPHAPKIFLVQGQLNMDLNVTIEKHELDTGIFEVVVRGTLTAKVGTQVAYLVEAEQAGIFQVANMTADQLDEVLNVTTPTLIYPYLRAAIADTIARTGMPVFHIPEVNWHAMYHDSRKALVAMPVESVVQ